MSALLLRRTALRRTALLGTGLSFSLGTAVALKEHRRPLRMDALSVPRPFTSQSAEKSPVAATKAKGLDPDVLRQLSGGSIGGKATPFMSSCLSSCLS